MAASYKTPGVYVEEIPKLPPSVAMVETAIPAFIGYTEKAQMNGVSIANKPTRISSMVEFETYFGGPYPYSLGDIRVTLDDTNNFAVNSVSFRGKSFYMYDAMRLFFDNGGGDCYIIAVGLYTANFTVNKIENSNAIEGGIKALEIYDEPTIIVIPDAVNLNEPEFYGIQQKVLAQCEKLQDRVGIFDVLETSTTPLNTLVSNYRNNIGMSSLKYGAAYMPFLLTSYPRTVDYKLLKPGLVGSVFTNPIVLSDSASTPVDLSTLTTSSDLNNMVLKMDAAYDDQGKVEAKIDTLKGSSKNLTDRYNTLKAAFLKAADADVVTAYTELVTFVRNTALAFQTLRTGESTALKNKDVLAAMDSAARDTTTGLRKYIIELAAFEKNTAVAAIVTGDPETYAVYTNTFPADGLPWFTSNAASTAALEPTFGPTTDAAEKKVAGRASLAKLDPIVGGLITFMDTFYASAKSARKIAQDALYNGHPVVSDIVTAVKKLMGTMPPTPAVAGVYARVDNKRGVWKAPANESLASVVGPTRPISHDDQKDMNVDTVAGKSINAIRTFTGKGTLIWGARTMSGNDNEWRYISVRRFFNMVEESSKKATEPFVFEPNDANTWVKVQGMIENFLTTLWRAGALQGAKPEHAFYVAVGLNKTMTALDILEGRMIVEIGMAVVRPAEFIILRFSHKMAES